MASHSKADRLNLLGSTELQTEDEDNTVSKSLGATTDARGVVSQKNGILRYTAAGTS